MKLQTFIRPRANGTVKVLGEDGQNYEFTADAEGVLVCDIEHEPTVERLLTLGDFEPVDAADFEAALALANKSKAADDEGDEGDGDDEGDGEEENPNALPVEANTPPVPKAAKKKAAAK